MEGNGQMRVGTSTEKKSQKKGQGTEGDTAGAIVTVK